MLFFFFTFIHEYEYSAYSKNAISVLEIIDMGIAQRIMIIYNWIVICKDLYRIIIYISHKYLTFLFTFYRIWHDIYGFVHSALGLRKMLLYINKYRLGRSAAKINLFGEIVIKSQILSFQWGTIYQLT